MGPSTRACVYGSYYKVNAIYYSVSFINTIYNNNRKKMNMVFIQSYSVCKRITYVHAFNRITIIDT